MLHQLLMEMFHQVMEPEIMAMEIGHIIWKVKLKSISKEYDQPMISYSRSVKYAQ
jgi:hypothetical protein